MEFNIKRRHIEIVPKSDIDEAYIEEVLGLVNKGDFCKLVRKNVHGLSALASLETEPRPIDTAMAWAPGCLAEAIANSSDPTESDEILADLVRAARIRLNDSSFSDIPIKQLEEAVKQQNFVSAVIYAIICHMLQERVNASH